MAITDNSPISAENLRDTLSDLGFFPGEAPDKPFAQLSWSELVAIAATANADNETTFKQTYSSFVGMTKTMSMGGYGDVGFICAGVCHDHDADGNPAAFTFIADRCLSTAFMNAENTTTGGWEGCSMRSMLNGCMVNAFTKPVRDALVVVEKACTSGSSYGAATTADRVWLPSYTEVGLGGSEGTA